MIWLPTVKTGLSEVIGSWKTIEICPPRTWRISRFERPRRFRPRSRTSPDSIRPGRSTSRRMESAVTDFPQPDSPTRPSVSPSAISNDIPSTARATPSSVRKFVCRSFKSILARCTPAKSLR